MASVEVKNFDSPDETRPFEGKGKADVLQVGGQTVGRGVFEPGWRWSSNVRTTSYFSTILRDCGAFIY